jgi:hypothetical protein
MRNRYGDVYDFVRESENTYRIAGDLKYWRFGGKEGQEGIDMNDLGMVDPSGGPFVELGMELGGRKIVRIRASGDLDGSPVVLFDVEPEK